MHIFKKFNFEKRRAVYALKNYRKYFGTSVLDVGAGASPLIFRAALGDAYKSVDVSVSRHTPDFIVNLEQEKLPFAENSFETVVCFDNLEHLENAHEMYDELIRVASRYVIVSLPNNWNFMLKRMFIGRNYADIVGYGFPAEKQGPGVRHKWFFNLEEAHLFLEKRAQKNGAKICELDFVYERGWHNLIKIPLIYPLLYNLNAVDVDRFYDLTDDDQVKFGKKAKLIHKLVTSLGRGPSLVLMQLVRLVSLPFWILDEILKHLIWGWGSRYRYLNVFCRQIWVVIQKNPSKVIR